MVDVNDRITSATTSGAAGRCVYGLGIVIAVALSTASILVL